MSRQFDTIGDIHGHAIELVSFLESLGYRRHGQDYRHSDRKVNFVGDFVDRGPAISDVIVISRATVEAGDGFTVIGNHEYNAVAFHTAVPAQHDFWFRECSDNKLKQHDATLDQLSPAELRMRSACSRLCRWSLTWVESVWFTWLGGMVRSI